MKIILTGGHLSPLLSVIDQLSKEDEILVLGRKYALEGEKVLSLEYQTLIKRGIYFKSIITGRLQRRLTKHTFFSLLKFPYGLFQSFFILMKFKPQVLLSFGGYVSLPVVVAGFFLRIPIVLHEQTLEAGMSNKIASFFAKKICISWESSYSFFPRSKTVFVGNPLRKEIEKTSDNDLKIKFPKNDLPFIFITGGSLGSHGINLLIEKCIKKLLKNYIVFHQTGDAKEFDDYNRLMKLREGFSDEFKNRYFLIKFVSPEEMGSLFKHASLVVCRSGINTVTELIFLKKPCLLIPLPFSQGGEQIKNALFLKKIGFAEVIDQEKITSDSLYEKIAYMINNLEIYKKIKKEHEQLIKNDSSLKIIDVLKSVVL